jgi:hypothetical protein
MILHVFANINQPATSQFNRTAELHRGGRRAHDKARVCIGEMKNTYFKANKEALFLKF